MWRLSLVLVIAACGAEHRGEPSGSELVPPTLTLAEGEHLFHKFCYQCHPGGMSGLGPAINDKPLPALAIRTQIRVGAGAMPSFGPDWLSDHQVDEIVR